MTRAVILHQRALADLNEARRYAAKHAPETALRWLNRFEQAIQTLELQAERCPLAKERLKGGFEVREYHFGDLPWVYRVLFVIDGDLVRVLLVRRAQRRGPSSRTLRKSFDNP